MPTWDYYVWLKYDAAAPVSKVCKSDELVYYSGHLHNVKPTDEQKDGLRESLYDDVEAKYAAYNRRRPAGVAAAEVPDHATIDAHTETDGKSERVK